MPYYRARYYFEQPSQIGQGRTWSLFIQDTMTVGSRLTLNLGLLTNSDAYSQDLPNSGGCPVPANTTAAATLPAGQEVRELQPGTYALVAALEPRREPA